MTDGEMRDAEMSQKTCDAEAHQNDLRKNLESLSQQLHDDINRPKGRWGIHGRECVDDDYFAALEYVAGKLDALLTMK